MRPLTGVHVSRVVQVPGEYVVTFPRAYHASLHTGFGLAEAACIAPLEWLPFGAASCARARRLGRGCMLPQEELLCAQAMELRGTIGGGMIGVLYLSIGTRAQATTLYVGSTTNGGEMHCHCLGSSIWWLHARCRFVTIAIRRCQAWQ